MKIHSLLFAVLLCALAPFASAEDAKVIKIVGAGATVTINGATKALNEKDAVPEGATINTPAGCQLMLETLPGVVATIQAGSTVVVEKILITRSGATVTEQEAMLDLKKGNVISTLDPAKKAINKYGVRTPKGVAAARGTVYGVSVSITGTSVATLSGTVTLNLGNGITVSIPLGSAIVPGSDTATTIANAIAASGQTGLSVSGLLSEAVSAVAANVAQNTSAAGGSDTATAVMAAVVSAASSAAPDQAAAFTKTAVAAVTASAGATGGSAASISAAVNAVTEAAVRAAPQNSAAIAQNAAAAVVETKVTEAINNARLTGGDAGAAAVAAQIDAAALNTTVAKTVVDTAASVGTTVAPATVSSAMNAGADTGSNSAASATQTSAIPPRPVQTPAPANPEAPSNVITTPTTPVDLPPVSPSGTN